MTHSSILVKRCPKCDTTQPLNMFVKDKNRVDGHAVHCKACRKEYYQQNKRRMIERTKKWVQDHPSRSRTHSGDYYVRHKAEIKVRRMGYGQRWVAKNREKKYAATRNRRARQANAEGTHTATDIKRQYMAQKGKCYWCGIEVKKHYHADHIVPLSRGGSNGPENIVVSCPSCNSSKKDKLPHEWFQGGRLL